MNRDLFFNAVFLMIFCSVRGAFQIEQPDVDWDTGRRIWRRSYSWIRRYIKTRNCAQSPMCPVSIYTYYSELSPVPSIEDLVPRTSYPVPSSQFAFWCCMWHVGRYGVAPICAPAV